MTTPRNTQSTHTLRLLSDASSMKKGLDAVDKELATVVKQMDRAAAASAKFGTAGKKSAEIISRDVVVATKALESAQKEVVSSTDALSDATKRASESAIILAEADKRAVVAATELAKAQKEGSSDVDELIRVNKQATKAATALGIAERDAARSKKALNKANETNIKSAQRLVTARTSAQAATKTLTTAEMRNSITAKELTVAQNRAISSTKTLQGAQASAASSVMNLSSAEKSAASSATILANAQANAGTRTVQMRQQQMVMGKAIRGNRAHMQNFGYQLQDTVVQLEMGTHWTRVFGQQGSQVFGMMGPWPAILSAVAGAILGIAHASGVFSEETKDVTDLVDDMTESFGEALSAIESLNDAELDQLYGNLAGSIESILEIKRLLNESTGFSDLEKLFESMDVEQVGLGMWQSFTQGLAMGATGQGNVLTDELFRKDNFENLGFGMGLSTFEGFRNSFENAAKNHDYEGAVRAIEAFSDAATGGKNQTIIDAMSDEGKELLLNLEKIGTQMAKNHGIKSGEAQAAEDLADLEEERVKAADALVKVFERQAQLVSKYQSKDAEADAKALAAAGLHQQALELRIKTQRTDAELAVKKLYSAEQLKNLTLAQTSAMIAAQRQSAQAVEDALRAADAKRQQTEETKRANAHEAAAFSATAATQRQADTARTSALKARQKLQEDWVNSQEAIVALGEKQLATITEIQAKTAEVLGDDEKALDLRIAAARTLAEEAVRATISAEDLANLSDEMQVSLEESAVAAGNLAAETVQAQADLNDATSNAKALATALTSAAAAMAALVGFGANLDKQLAQAGARVDALVNGMNAANAGNIAGMRIENQQKLMAALAKDGADRTEVIGQFIENRQKINKLAITLETESNLKDNAKGGGGGKKEESYAKLIRELETQRDLLGVDQQRLEVNKKLGRSASKVSEDQIQYAIKLKNDIEQITRALDDQQQIWDHIGSEFTTSFTSIIDGTETVEDAFKRMSKSIIDELFQVLVMQRLIGAAGVNGSAGRGLLGWISGLLPSANGNVFEGGNVIPFAKGGVVTAPTVFPMASGAGLMGESGPEAIVPLSRGTDGKLGVGGSPVVVNVINNNGSEVSIEQNEDGINIIIDRAVSAVEGKFTRSMATGQGVFSRAFESGYNARRKAV